MKTTYSGKPWAHGELCAECGIRIDADGICQCIEVLKARWPILTELLGEELDIVERLLAKHRAGKHKGDRFLEKETAHHLNKAEGHMDQWRTAPWFPGTQTCDTSDPESGEPILAHVAARALFALACEQRGRR